MHDLFRKFLNPNRKSGLQAWCRIVFNSFLNILEIIWLKAHKSVIEESWTGCVYISTIHGPDAFPKVLKVVNATQELRRQSQASLKSRSEWIMARNKFLRVSISWSSHRSPSFLCWIYCSLFGSLFVGDMTWLKSEIQVVHTWANELLWSSF